MEGHKRLSRLFSGNLPAMFLDICAVAGQYIERHENSLERLEMRITLYDSPEDPLLLAAQIIEQAGSTGSGTMTMRRAHLMKAGQALSPDAFSLVIEAESFNKGYLSQLEINPLQLNSDVDIIEVIH